LTHHDNFGNGDDLQIYHDGSKSIISDSGTGHLEINTNNLRVQNAAANETLLYCTENGSVELYYDNSKKFESASTGVTVTANSDIRLTNGSWTGESTKIQHHSNSLYLQGGTGTHCIIFRDPDGTNRWSMLDSGHLYPMADSAYDIGTNSHRVRNGYFDTLYGDGSNLTGVDPTIADGCIYENNQTISSTVSTSSSKNSFAAGDINITGTLTVADNTNFVII
jgi:hypothetical protein